ncbi:glycoside hydrolase family 13 protein [Polychaeton citri CBS 116435]|uniref:Glycoside hydrolase family 13 protein n=1 Tax=Polychaeton citri CBS 116435 TaxID=1314669 RepID=A0A9P4QF39_9PEZI|nr:glycoside hydrolase family 13 protein [Polychaeton citri CBS 116435]
MPHSTAHLTNRHWWHSATVYQIYPSSYKDSNADGFGDIEGIISKVPHIASLGVDAVWLSPCYKSPLADMGYDIADYREIDPRYGSVADVERLLARLKEHNIKLLMDLVVNHTSDQHAWFQESRSSLNNPKRDWYIWRKGTTKTLSDGSVVRQPPNNWESLFKGSAWEYDEHTGEYYLRIFCKEQPDLNWDCPELRKAVHDDMRFWLDKGIGGFRMDVINMISKPEGLPDAPITRPGEEFQHAASVYCNGPRIHEYITEIRREVLDHYDDVMTVGEVPFTSDPEAVRKYVEPSRKELCMLFQFDIFDIDTGPGGKFTPSGYTLGKLKRTIAHWQQALSFSSGAWQTVFLESHDAARSVSRFGDRTAENRWRVAKMLAMMETTLSGTLFMHQGQEIGIANLADDIPIEEYGDIETINFFNALKEKRQAEAGAAVVDMSDVVEQVRLKARDHGRMPIPWDASSKNNGFSDADDLWARMNSDSAACNVAQQDKSPESVLNFWRKMLAFRREHAEALVFGDFVPVDVSESDVFAYRRVPIEEEQAKEMLILLNMSNKEGVEFHVPESSYNVLVSTSEEKGKQRRAEGGKIVLSPYEGLVLQH